jgi:apolipoprotein N-acyltransferase
MGTDPIFRSSAKGKWGLSPFFPSFLALFAGAATVLAFAPAGLYPLAPFSFAMLIHLWVRAGERECFWTGFAFGLGLFGAGASWVYVSLSQFGGMPAPVAGVATLGFCALLALFTGAAGWLQARVPASDVVRACLLIPASWTLCEWLRMWVLTGFPWLSAGYAATGWPTQGFAPLAGVFGASLVTLCLAGTVWVMARNREGRVLAMVSFVALIALGEALRHVEWTEPRGAPVSVALLQGNIAQDLKFLPERYAHTLEAYATLVEETAAKLIVLPETAIPRLYDRIDPAYISRLESAARRNDGDLLLGVPFRAGPSEYYNSVLSLGVSGRQLYHKTHLVPFGEFVPPGFGWVMRMLDIPLSDFSRGAPEQPPLAVAGQSVAISICYEDAFGEDVARRLPKATLLVNVSNVAWFGDSLAPAQHLQIARLRAIETGRMHLAATNTGITAAIDRDGRVLARLPQFAEGRLEIAAQGYAGATPFVRLGDAPVIFFSLFVLIIAVAIARLGYSR